MAFFLNSNIVQKKNLFRHSHAFTWSMLSALISKCISDYQLYWSTS